LQTFAQLQDQIRGLEAERSELMQAHDSMESQALASRDAEARRKQEEVLHATGLLRGLEQEKHRVVELVRLKQAEKATFTAEVDGLTREKEQMMEGHMSHVRQASALEEAVQQERATYAIVSTEVQQLRAQHREGESSFEQALTPL